MSDRGTKAAGLSTSHPTAPVPAPEGSLIEAPPPYSACAPYPPTINSNYPDRRSPISANPPGSENDVTGHILRTTPYNPQPSYNPSYTADRQNNPRTNVYGRKTIVLQRTDAENSARKKKRLIACCVGIVVVFLIPIIILTTILTTIPRRGRRFEIANMDNANDHSYNNAYDGRIFDNSHVKPIDPYLTDRHNDNSDDLSWKPKNSVTAANPFLDDKYKDKVDKEPWREKTDEEIFPELGIVVPDYEKKLKDILNWGKHDDKFSDDSIIKTSVLSDEMKDLLGIPRENTMENE